MYMYLCDFLVNFEHVFNWYTIHAVASDDQLILGRREWDGMGRRKSMGRHGEERMG